MISSNKYKMLVVSAIRSTYFSSCYRFKKIASSLNAQLITRRIIENSMQLYAWGANSHGQLGLGHLSEFELPAEVKNHPDEINHIVCGAGHTAMLETSGKLWMCGRNNKGQLGLGTTISSLNFERLECDQKFLRVFLGWDSTAGNTPDGRLFLWGSNINSQLGMSNERLKVFTSPTELRLPFNEKVEDIQFCLKNSVILTKSNKVFIVGASKYFKKEKLELINHDGTEFLYLYHSCKVLQIACGQNHFMLLDEKNTIRVVGENRFMQCSNLLPTEKVVQIASGWTHSAFLTETKELYLFGRNSYGQLGNGSRDPCTTIQRCPIQPVDEFHLGSEHGILKSKNQIYTWGWNEHANCGDSSCEDILTPKLVQIPNERKDIKLYAGFGYCMVAFR